MQWHPDPQRLARPVYLSLAEQFTQAIQTGRLGAGTRLPPQRTLADRLGVSLQTVSRAYDELARRGMIAGEVGRGTFVLPQSAEAPAPYLNRRTGGVVDLSILKPVTDALHLQKMREGLAWLAENLPPQAALSFRPTSVMPEHLKTAAAWLARGGIDVAPEQIVITDGATPAITTAVMTAVPPGGTLAAAELTHHLLQPLTRYLGLHLEPLPLDDHGIVPAALEQAARTKGLSALYLQPAAINPRGVLSPAERRAEIVAIARRHNLALIENDILNQLLTDRPTPYAALAPERVLHINGFTKISLPGLRVAYLTLPERLARAAANRHLVTNWMATPIMVELLGRWIADGTMTGLVGWQRQALAERHAIARAVLPDGLCRSHAQALHLWLELPAGIREEEFVAMAHRRGVAVASSQSFRIGGQPGPGALRIALGPPSRDDLSRGLATVAELLAESDEPILPLV